MPQEFGPTLIRTSALVLPASTGAVDEMEFNFGNLEGARLLAVEYGSSGMQPSASGYTEYGLNFTGSIAAPVAVNDIALDENVFAFQSIDHVLVTTGSATVMSRVVDLRPMELFIVRNIALQVFTVATTSGVVARVYYRRVIFTQNEIGGVIAFRR